MSNIILPRVVQRLAGLALWLGFVASANHKDRLQRGKLASEVIVQLGHVRQLMGDDQYL